MFSNLTPEQVQEYLGKMRNDMKGQQDLDTQLQEYQRADEFNKVMRRSTNDDAPIDGVSSGAVDINPQLAEYNRLGLPYSPGHDTKADDFAKRQGTMEQLGNAGYRFFWNTLYDTVGGTAAMLDIEDYFNTDDEIGNETTRWMEELKQKTKDTAPIYQRTNSGMGDSAYWIANGADIASSVAAFGLQGFGIGKGLQAVKFLGSLAKVGSKGKAAMRGADAVMDTEKIVDKGATWYDKIMSAGTLDAGRQVGRQGQNLLTSAMLNQAESIMSASQVYDDLYRKAIDQGYSEEYAKEVAAKGGSNVINLNRANILLNLTMADKLLMGKANIGNLVNKRDWKNFGKEVAWEGGQEATEELVNLFAEKQGQKYGETLLENKGIALDKKNLPSTKTEGFGPKDVGLDLSNPFGDATVGEIFETATLGALGGTGQLSLVRGANMLKTPTINIGGFNIGLGTTEDARYETNQYYADGSIKAKKGDLMYQTKDMTYNDDVIDGNGNVVHKKGDVVYATSNEVDDITGEFKKDAKQEIVLDEKGKPKSFKVGEVDNTGKEIVGAKAKRYSMTELINSRADRVADIIKPLREQNEQFSRIMGGAKVQNELESTISAIDNMITKGKGSTFEEIETAYNKMAAMELLNEGSELTEKNIVEKAKELREAKLNETQLRKRQDDLLEMSLAHKAVQAFELNGKDHLINVFKDIMHLNEKEAKQKGYGDDYKEKAKESIDKVQEYYNRWREYNAKHSPEKARRLFLNRLNRDSLGTEMQIINKEALDLHDKEYSRYTAEAGLNEDDFDVKTKYDKAFEIEKKRQDALDRNKELKRLAKERKELDDEFKKMQAEFEKEIGSNSEVIEQKKKLKEVSDKAKENSTKQKEAEDKVNKEYDDQLNELKLPKIKSGIRNQAEIYKGKLNKFNKAIALDKEFDRLRSDEGDKEIERQDLEKRNNMMKNIIYKKTIEMFLKVQKEKGKIYYKIDDQHSIEGVLVYKNGEYVFVADQTSFVVDENRVNEYEFASPANKSELKEIDKAINELNEEISKVDSETEKQIAQNNKDLIDSLKDVTKESTRNTILEFYTEKTNKTQQAAENLKIDNNEKIKQLEESKKKLSFYTVSKGVENTEDEDLNIVSTNPLEIDINYDELANLVYLEEKDYIKSKAIENTYKVLTDKLARISRAINKRDSEMNNVLDNNKETLDEYKKLVNEHNRLVSIGLYLQRKGNVTGSSFTFIETDENGNEVETTLLAEDYPELTELRMTQLKMQDEVVTFLQEELNNERKKLANIEKDTEDINQRIDSTNRFIERQYEEWLSFDEKDKNLLEFVKSAGRKKSGKIGITQKDLNQLTKETAKLNRKERTIVIAKLREAFGKGLPARIDSAQSDLKILESRKKELEKLASPEMIDEAKTKIKAIEAQLKSINSTGFSYDFFYMLSEINSLENKKKEIDSMTETRASQLKALKSLFDTYMNIVASGEKKDAIKSIQARRYAAKNKFDNLFDSLMLDENLDHSVKYDVLGPARRNISKILNGENNDFESQYEKVNATLRKLYEDGHITIESFRDLMDSWTKYTTLTSLSNDFKGNKIELASGEEVSDSDKTLVAIMETLYNKMQEVQQLHIDDLNEINNIIVRQNALAGIKNSTLILFTPEYTARFLENTSFTNKSYDQLIGLMNESMEKVGEGYEKVSELLKEKEAIHNELTDKIAKLKEERNALILMNNQALVEYDTFSKDSEVQDYNNFIDKFSIKANLKLINSLEEEISILDGQVNELRKTLELLHASIFENIGATWTPGTGRQLEDEEAIKEQLSNQNISYNEAIKAIRNLLADIENTEKRREALIAVYQTQGKIATEIEEALIGNETEDTSEDEENVDDENTDDDFEDDSENQEEEGDEDSDEDGQDDVEGEEEQEEEEEEDLDIKDENPTQDLDEKDKPSKEDVTEARGIDDDIDAKTSLFTSAGKHVRFDNKNNKRIFDVNGRPIFTLNTNDQRWFDKMNEVADEKDYTKKYSIKFVKIDHPDIIGLNSYDDDGNAITFGQYIKDSQSTAKPLTAENMPLLQVLVDAVTGEYIRSDKGELFFVANPVEVKEISKALREYAVIELKAKEGDEGSIRAALNKKMKEFTDQVRKSLYDSKEVILPINRLSKGNPYGSHKAVKDGSWVPDWSVDKFRKLINDFMLTKDEFKFGTEKTVKETQVTKPGLLYIKVPGGYVQLKGRPIIESPNDIEVLQHLFSKWSTSSKLSNDTISVVKDGVFEKANTFKLINEIIYYNKPEKNKPFAPFQMRYDSGVLKYKPVSSKEGKDAVKEISKSELSTLTNPDGSVKPYDELTTTQKEFIDFLKTFRKQIFKKKLSDKNAYYHPTEIKDGKLILKKYKSYGDYLMSKDTPLTAMAEKPEGKKSPIMHKYVEFNPSSVFESSVTSEVPPSGIPPEDKKDDDVEDKNVGTLERFPVYNENFGEMIITVKSDYKNGNKYAIVIAEREEEFISSRGKEVSVSPLAISHYINGALVKDEKLIQEVLNALYPGEKLLSNSKIKYGFINNSNVDMVQGHFIEYVSISKNGIKEGVFKLIPNATTKEDIETNNDIKKALKFVNVTTTKKKPKPVEVSFDSLKDNPLFEKFKPLLSALSFKGKIEIDTSQVGYGASYNRNTMTISLYEALNNKTSALNLVHELVHVGTLYYLDKKENHSSDEYKRLQNIHKVIFQRMFNDKKLQDYMLKGINDTKSNYPNALYILLSGKLSDTDLAKKRDLLLKMLANKTFTDKDYNELLGSTPNLTELVTYIMSNKEFQEALNEVKLTDSEKELLGTKSKTLWTALLELIRTVFDIRVKDGSLLKEAIEATADITGNLDKGLSEKIVDSEENNNSDFSNFANYDDKQVFSGEINPGDVVKYNVEGKDQILLVSGITKSGALHLQKADGTKLSGTPMPDKVEFVGYFAKVEFENNTYIVLDNDNIVSVATGEKVFFATDDSTLARKERLLAAYQEQNDLSNTSDELTDEDIRNEIDKWKEESDELDFSPIRNSSQKQNKLNELSSLSEKEFNKFNSAITNIFNNFETLSSKDRTTSLKNTLSNTLSFQDQYKLINLVNNEFNTLVNKYKDDLNITEYDAINLVISDLFEEYLNDTLKNESINEIFDAVAIIYNEMIVSEDLQNYRQRNPFNNLNIDKGLVHSPIMNTKLEIEGIELSQEESTAVMDGMTSMLFEYFKTQDIDAFYEGNVDWNEAYSFVREKLKKDLNDKGKRDKEKFDRAISVISKDFETKKITKTEFKKLELIYKSKLDGLKRLVKIREILLLPSKGDEQWLKAWKRHADRMRAYGVKYDVDDYVLDETEAGRDREFGKEQGSTDERENIPPAVRLWIATRNKSKEVNSLGFPTLMDFNESYNYLVNKLAGLPAQAEIINDKLKELKNELTENNTKKVDDLSDYLKQRYYLLNSILGEDNIFEVLDRPKTATFYDKKLSGQLVQTFTKQKPLHVVGRITEDGDTTFFNSNQNKTSDNILSEWRSNYTEKLESTSKGKQLSRKEVENFIATIEKIEKLPGNKVTNELKNEFITALEKLGIKLSSFDKVESKLEALGKNEGLATIVLGSIVNASLKKELEKLEESDTHFPLNYSPLNDRSIQSKVTMLAEIEADINQTIVNNQFISAGGEVQYGISLNHQVSNNTNDLNYIVSSNEKEEDRRRVIKERSPHLLNVANENSVLMNQILRDGIKVENALFSGLTSETSSDGLVIKELGEANRWNMLIASTMANNPVYTFYRAADRTVEGGFRFLNKSGAPIKIFGDGENIHGIANAMRGYLRDELKSIIYLSHLGIGEDIIYYKKGGLSFKYFSDDKLIYNRYQDSQIDYKKILLDKIPTFISKQEAEKIKLMSPEDRSRYVDKLISTMLDKDTNTNITKAFIQHFQRKAYGHYYNDSTEKTDKVIPTKVNDIKSAKKDYLNSVKYKLEKLGLLKVVPKKVNTVYNKKTRLYENEETADIERQGKYFAGISASIFNRYILDDNGYSPENIEIALESLLENFEAIQFGSYVELGKLQIGDPTMFKNQDDFFKRMAMFTSTKKISEHGDKFNNFYNKRNSAKFYVLHNGIKTYLNNVPLDRSELNNLTPEKVDKLKSKYQNKITRNIEDHDFLSGYDYTNVKLELEDGYKKYYDDETPQWRNAFKSVIFEDIKTMSTLALEDGVTKIQVVDGNIVYYSDKIDKEGNRLEVASNDVSELTKLFTESFVKDGITETIRLTNKVLSYTKNYKGYDESDGQAYMTLDAYKEMLTRSGDWTKKHHDAFSKIQQGYNLTAEEVVLFPVLKTQYAGPLWNTGELSVPAGYKHSVFPLIPQFIKNTKLDDLRKFMEENDISLANMHSANKYGTKLNKDGDIMTMYNKNGEFKYNSKTKELNNRSIVTQETEWRWFGVQVDQAPKFKKNITVGSQFRKLALSNILSNGIPVDFEGNNWNELTEVEKNKQSKLYSLSKEYIDIQAELVDRPFNDLVDELGLEGVFDGDKLVGYKINNREGLIDIVVDSQEDRNLPDNVIISLNSLKDDTIFIEQVLNKEKVEQILNALINSRVIKEKRKGEMSPQIASTMFEFNKSNIIVTEGTRLVNVKSGKVDKRLAIQSALKTYRKGFDGQTLPAESMISLPKEWITWINESQGGLEGFNAKLDALHSKLYQIEEQGNADLKLTLEEENLKKLITMIGFRIPNQGLNSSDYMRVRRFMDPTFGYSIVVPSEMIPKAGSDFDIDKLSVYHSHYNKPYKDKKGVWTAPLYSEYMNKVNYSLDTRYDAYVDSIKFKRKDMKEDDENKLREIENLLESTYTMFKDNKNELLGEAKEIKKRIGESFDDIKTKQLDVNKKDESIDTLIYQSNTMWKMLPYDIKNVIKGKHSSNFATSSTENFVITISIVTDMINNIDKTYNKLSNKDKEIYESVDYLEGVLESFKANTEDIVTTMNKGKEFRTEISNILDQINNLKESRGLLYDASNNFDDLFTSEKGSMIDQIKSLFREIKIKEMEIMSKEDFDKLPDISTNTKSALENRMIEIQSELIKHPMNYRQLMSPITDVVLNDKDEGIVWDTRMMQDTETIKIDDKNVIASVYLNNAKENIIKRIMFENGKFNKNNVKGYINANGKLITDTSPIENNTVKYSNVVLSDDKVLYYMGEVAKEYQKVRSLWVTTREKSFKEGSFAQITSSVTNMNKFIEFISGKSGGVGQTAVHITHHQLGCAVNLHMNNKNPLWVFDHNKTEDGYPSFANIKGTDGELISETLSAFLNAYVDVAKDPYIYGINAGSQTANMIFMLIRAGAPIKWIGRFLSQPSVKDYVREQSSNESIFVKSNGMELKKDALVKQVLAKYSHQDIPTVWEKRESYDNGYQNTFDKLVLENKIENLTPYELPNVDTKTWESYQDFIESGLFSYEKLGDYISYNSFSENQESLPSEFGHITSVFNKSQGMLLDMFLEYQRQSKHFQEMIRATSADTKGISQNRQALETDVNTTKKVLLSKMWVNVEKLIDNTIVNRFQKVREATLQAYKPLYLVEQRPEIKRVVTELFQTYSPILTDSSNRIKLHNNIVNDLIMAFRSVNYDENNTRKVYESMVVPTEESAIFRDENGKPISLPQFLNNLNNKKLFKTNAKGDLRKYWKLRDNKLVSKLSGFTSNMPLSYDKFKEKGSIAIGKPSVNYIKFHNSKGIQEEINAMTEALQEIKEDFPDFYKQLTTFAIFQSGFNTTPNSFVSKIPSLDVLIGNKIALESFYKLSKEQQAEVLEEFKNQFQRRNLQYNPGIKRYTNFIDIKQVKDGVTKVIGQKKLSSMRINRDNDGVANTDVNKYGFIVGVKKDDNDMFRRYAIEGFVDENNDDYLNLSFSKDQNYGNIVGEEMYFTGYDIDVLNQEEASARYKARIELRSKKAQEMLDTFKARFANVVETEDRVSEIKELESGLTYHSNALTKEEQTEFFDFAKRVLEKNAYNPYPQYVMASAGEVEWTPEAVVDKEGNMINRTTNIEPSIVSYKKYKTGTDGKEPRWKYHYNTRNLDGSPIEQIPDNIRRILEKVTGQSVIDYDTVLINLYPLGRTLGWHVDTSEDWRNMNRDIISVSIGADADFTYVNTKGVMLSGRPDEDSRYKDKVNKVMLKSGDVVVFGGEARLLNHTVTNVSGTSSFDRINLSESNVNKFFNKGELILDNYRINLTFRVAKPGNNNGKKIISNPRLINTSNTNQSESIYKEELGNKTASENVVIPFEKPSDYTWSKAVSIAKEGISQEARTVTSKVSVKKSFDEKIKELNNSLDEKNVLGIIDNSPKIEFEFKNREKSFSYLTDKISKEGDYYRLKTTRYNVLINEDFDIVSVTNLDKGTTYRYKPEDIGYSYVDILSDVFGDNNDNKTISNSEIVTTKTKGVVAMRNPKGGTEHFGNPFTHDAGIAKKNNLIKTKTIKEAVIGYLDWLLTDKYLDVEPTRRQWIINQLKSGDHKGKKIVYYTELNQPSHATAMDYLINKHDWDKTTSSNNVKLERTTDIITRDVVKNNQDTLFIFGDNFTRKGLGGQAKEMRGENNAFGIVTKKLPSNTNDSFMTDTELDSNKREITNDVNRIIDEFKTGKYKKIILPTIGVGLAKLNTKAPLTWNHLQAELNRLESTVNATNQTESSFDVYNDIPFSPIRDTKIDYNKAENEKLDLFNKLMNKEPNNECNK